jgi:hypothetical protein
MRNWFPVSCEEGRGAKTPFDYTALRDAVAQISKFYCSFSTATSLPHPTSFKPTVHKRLIAACGLFVRYRYKDCNGI